MYKVKDNAEAQLQFGISSVATTIVVKEGQGARFPEVPFLAVLNKRNSDWEITKSEKVEVSAVSGDQFTISRGYEWTTPSDFSADDFVSLFVLAKHIEELQTEVAKKADQTDVQSVAQRTDSLEEKITTAEGKIEKLEEAGESDHLSAKIVLWESLTGDTYQTKTWPWIQAKIVRVKDWNTYNRFWQNDSAYNVNKISFYDEHNAVIPRDQYQSPHVAIENTGGSTTNLYTNQNFTFKTIKTITKMEILFKNPGSGQICSYEPTIEVTTNNNTWTTIAWESAKPIASESFTSPRTGVKQSVNLRQWESVAYTEEEKKKLTPVVQNIPLFKQKLAPFSAHLLPLALGDVDARKELHIQAISSWIASNKFKLSLAKVGAPTTSIIIEVKKGEKVEIPRWSAQYWEKNGTEVESYWYGDGAVLASATIPYTQLTTDFQELEVTLNQTLNLEQGELYSIILKQTDGIVNTSNYYTIACDKDQYSEAFSAVAVNGTARSNTKLIPYCRSESLITECLARISEIKRWGSGRFLLISDANKRVYVERYQTTILQSFSGYSTYHIEYSPQNVGGEYGIIVRVNGEQRISSGYSAVNQTINVSSTDVVTIVAHNWWSSNQNFGYTNLKVYVVNPLLTKQGESVLPREWVPLGKSMAVTIFGVHIDDSWKLYWEKQIIPLNLTLNQYKISTQRPAPSDGLLVVDIKSGMTSGITIGDQRFYSTDNTEMVVPVLVRQWRVNISSQGNAHIKLLYFIPL